MEFNRCIIFLLFHMKKFKSQVFAHTQQAVKTYLKIFPSNGIDPVSDSDYEILDGNTLLDKRNQKKLVMYPFSYVFNHELDNSKLVEHMKLANDAFEGKNQLMIANIDKQNFHQFVFGNNDEPGLIIEAFLYLFREHNILSLTEDELPENKSHISFSMFSSEGMKNKFVDLILGQKSAYFSKKDIDEYKNFYEKSITSIRQFLIALKIGIIRYRECCHQLDPLIFRFNVHNHQTETNNFYTSSFHLIVGIYGTKIMQCLSLKVEQSFTENNFNGEDHGSLVNYMQKIVQKGKIIYLYGFAFRKETMKKSVQMFNYLMNLKEYSTTVFKNSIENPDQVLKKIKNFQLQKCFLDINNLTQKQITLINRHLQRLTDYFAEVHQKWKLYCLLIQEVRKVQAEFYDKQKFPVSLEIKDHSVKSFIISKIYKLSEKFQMEDLSSLIEKIRIIKNQIFIGFKALSQISQTKQTKETHGKSYSEFCVYYRKLLTDVSKVIKWLFTFNSRVIQFYSIDLSNIEIMQVFNMKIGKDMMNKLKMEGKNPKQRDEILIRRINRNEIEDEAKEFKLFQELKNGSKSLAQIHSINEERKERKSNPKSSCLFPKIAVIHRKKKCT